MDIKLYYCVRVGWIIMAAFACRSSFGSRLADDGLFVWIANTR